MPDARTLDDLETPAAVVDVVRMHDNLRRAAEYCHAHGLGWRPHTKTHKIAALAAMHTQTGPAMAQLGSAYRELNAEECFVAAPRLSG